MRAAGQPCLAVGVLEPLHAAAAGNWDATRVEERAARGSAEKRREPSVRLEMEFTKRSAYASLVRWKKALGATSEIPPLLSSNTLPAVGKLLDSSLSSWLKPASR